jgi:hypothetical protein
VGVAKQWGKEAVIIRRRTQARRGDKSSSIVKVPLILGVGAIAAAAREGLCAVDSD